VRIYWQFLTQSWPLLAFGFFTIFWGNLGQTFFISWYGIGIQESLGMSAGHYGAIYSAATLLSSLIILSFGGLIDHWPLRRFVTLAALGLLAACLLMASTVNALLLFGGFFLLRLCGQGLLPHTAQTTMARYLDQHRGKALSASASGVPVGEMILPGLAVLLIAAIGWRSSWLVLALTIPLVYLPLIHWLLRRSPVDVATPPVSAIHTGSTPPAGRREMLTDRRFWLALPTALSAPFIITGVFIHQGFILEQKGWSPVWLATCFVMFGAAHWLSSISTGILVDRFSARRLLRLIMLPQAAALFSLVGFEGQWVAALFMTLLGTTIGTSAPVMGALWAEVYGVARLGSIRSLMTSLMMIASALSPILFGLLIDAGISVQSLYSGAGLGVVMAWLLVQFSYRPES
jgi:predicted MFS family arabinose efflux permease